MKHHHNTDVAWYIGSFVAFYLFFLTRIMGIVTDVNKKELAETIVPTTRKQPRPTQDDSIPLQNLWNPSIVSSKRQTADAPPEESQWLKTPIDQSAFDYPFIPKRVHKVYIEKSGKFPLIEDIQGSKNLNSAQMSWITANPGYSVDAYNLADCRKYLAKNFHPIFLRTFDCISAFSGKVNFFRMAVVYLEGGWYSDWKQVCLEDGLLESLGRNASLYVVWDHGFDWTKNEKCMQNCFFGASPSHPLIAIMLKKIMHNVRYEVYGNTPIHPTGPCLFGQAYQEYLKRLNPSKIGVREGIFKSLNIYDMKGGQIDTSRTLIQHKCKDCGISQNWGKQGNDYNDMHSQRRYYCQDAQSLYASLQR